MDVQLGASMGPPGGGRAMISSRFQSCCGLLNFPNPQDSQVKKIYLTLARPAQSVPVQYMCDKNGGFFMTFFGPFSNGVLVRNRGSRSGNGTKFQEATTEF